MKTAKKFVRHVRSKSPFRRRKRAETIIAEVRDKEKAFARQLNAPGGGDHTSQPDDQAEIEVVLESSSCDIATASRTQSDHSDSIRTPPRKEDAVPDLVPSASSGSTEDPPALTGPQAAARRFMERQQRLAAGNRRKSFRDRFMRPSKSSSTNNHNPTPTRTPPPPPSPPSPAQKTKQMGISVRGRTRSSNISSSSTGRAQGSVTQERGRSKERSTRGGGLGGRGSSARSKQSPARSRTNQSVNRFAHNNNDEPDKQLQQQLAINSSSGNSNKQSNATVTARQPVTIEVGNQSRVSELSTPAAIIRQESLGTESIRGVRQALQKMELELAAAGDAGKRVSRDKIMNALNYMANALHYDDQKEFAKELDAWIDESVIGADRTRVYTDEDDDDDNSNEDDTSLSDDDASGSTFDLEAFEDGRSVRKQRQTHSSFQDLFLRLGKFFTISEEDKTAVRQALDDLLWTELAGNRPEKSMHSSSDTGDDGSESSEDSIGNFDPLSCNIQDIKREPSAPTRGRSWWRRHGIGSSNTKTKKENLYPVKEGPPSPESKTSVPSPTGKVNPRSSKSKGSGKSSTGSGGGKSQGSGGRSGGSRSDGKSSGILAPPPPRKSALKERTPTSVPKSRFMMDESDSGWSSFDETTSDFWRQGDRYTIPSKPKESTQQAQLVNHYKLSYPPSWQDSDPFFDADFLDSPKEDYDDEFDDWDNCLHPAENLNQRRQPQT